MTTTKGTYKKDLKDLPTAEEVLKQKRAAARRVREEAKKTKDWTDRMAKVLVGKKIMNVRYMTSEEARESGWCKRPLLIQLNDGTVIIPLQDDEANDAGSLEFFHPETELEEGGSPVMWVD
jgi:hypothetical protein